MEEEPLYLTIVTAEKFKKHQGFDLANFEHQFLSDVHTYKMLKVVSYGAFKENISRNFNIPSEQLRFWVHVNRQNKTVRPDDPIPEYYYNISMGEIHAKMTSRRDGMELYMEVADKPFNEKTWFPPMEGNNYIIVFLKYFDPDKQTLEGLGHLYVRRFDKVGDYTRVLCEKKEFPPDIPLKIYEEIKPNMIEEMKLEFTFQQSQIQNGDIICFQKALIEKDYKLCTITNRIHTIPQYYRLLTTFSVKVVPPIVTAEKFKKYQGFDLANFDHSDIHIYKILKEEIYGAFKENISRTFNIPSEQVRFWVFVNRQNKTIRPDSPISESRFNISMGKIHPKMTSEMKLYMEVADKPFDDKTWFPPMEGNNHILIFLKYFDPDKQTLEGLGHLYVQKFDKVGDYTRVLCEKKEFPPDTPLKIYEEIKPNMIEEMKLESTFEQSQIQDGDIICFQKILTKKDYESYTITNRIHNITQFYELLMTFTVKVVTAEIFIKYQEFYLANFEHQYNISKIATYGAFKENVARRFNILPEQIRFWVLVSRENKIVRPHTLIPDSFLNKSMNEIHEKMIPLKNEIKLYMELADKKINGNWFPSMEENINIMVFLKYFDPDAQTFEGLGHLYVRKYGKLGDYNRDLCMKKNFPSDTPLTIYKENKPNIVQELNLKYTFTQSDIQNGDIICFQKTLTDKEIQEHTEAGRIHNILNFYNSLNLRTIVSFKPKLEDRNSKPQFDLILNKQWTYDKASVALYLNTDPFKIRLTATCHTLKRTTNQTLLNQTLTYEIPTVFYEILDESNIEPVKPKEPKTEKLFKIIWLGNIVKHEEIIDICLQKDAIVSEIITEILKKVTLSSPNARIRLYKVMNHKIQKEYKETELIGMIKEFTTLYAEEIPQDELLADFNDRIIQVFHFTKEPHRTHGIPFKFIIKNGETLADLKIRLQLRLDMNQNDFEKIRVAIFSILSVITCEKPVYPKDDDIIVLEKIFSKIYYLGLDHEIEDKPVYIRG
ncbi:ICP0-binding domain of ubiquitin-specific protease 7-domain-containing protein [Glomus cerebriforme]|uniref:ubiquitinyl hydrolase 1 n=1 Tax=Glomus cerebriforme TaxID=658196 RepID=A0A397TBZ4_9GLOM|nr:ICP0-binding domain of ubiquitin-specific protease 7-domain-containing protein [Glomus cerebriforme]